MHACNHHASSHLTDDDARLHAVEQNAHLKPKVRVREAQVLRLSHRGHTIGEIAAYTGRHRSSISRDLDRWRDHGVTGLVDGTAPGQPPRLTAEGKAFLRDRLGEDRTWTAGQLAAAVETHFGRAAREELARQKGADRGELTLRYLDESGVGLSLPPSSTWTQRGQAHQHRVPARWGSQGRINLIGTLALEADTERLEYHRIAGACRAQVVVRYLGALAAQAEATGSPTVVVLDNAPFHRARAVQQAQARWARQGLTLYYLPAYCPHLNRIEGVWQRLKGFLLPRRCYDSVTELTEAVLAALHLLGAVKVQCSLGDT